MVLSASSFVLCGGVIEKDRYLVYLVCLVCLVKQDQPDEPNRPDEPDRPSFSSLLPTRQPAQAVIVMTSMAISALIT
jgi:hypothetical protein